MRAFDQSLRPLDIGRSRAIARRLRSFEDAPDASGNKLAMRWRLSDFTVAVVEGPLGVILHRHGSDDIPVRIVARAVRHRDLLHRNQVVRHRPRYRAQVSATQVSSHFLIRDLQSRHPRHEYVTPGKKVARIVNLIRPWHRHARLLVEDAREEALGRKLGRSMRCAAEYELAGARANEQVLPEQPERHRLHRQQITEIEAGQRAAKLVVTDRPEPFGSLVNSLRHRRRSRGASQSCAIDDD